jgi:cytochrome P450
VDPPDHTRFRRLVSRAFTPRSTAAFEPVVQRTADALLNDLEARRGTLDLVETYAAQLPVLAIAHLLGVPSDRRADFLRWGAAAAATLDPGLPFGRYLAADRALRAMHAFLREHFERLRRDPADDLVSRLVGLPEEEALTERELHATVILLLGAGFETTVNLLGDAVVLLDAHRDQWDALVAEPAGWDGAVEEVLRGPRRHRRHRPSWRGWRASSGCVPWRSASPACGSAVGRCGGICRPCGGSSTFR